MCDGGLKVPDVGPWSATKITWPLGSSVPGASSAPSPLGMVGPATQLFVEGV
jgi:hypothetical protein